jgi:hypothetical protein
MQRTPSIVQVERLARALRLTLAEMLADQKRSSTLVGDSASEEQYCRHYVTVRSA